MLTTESVIAMAPDEASAKAARGLVVPAKWPLLGADERAVWGECQGSGAKPYQTQVDLSGPAFRCSCPSRKFPCKHGLALMLLRVQDASRFAGASAPAWVNEWLASRSEKAQKKEERLAERAAAPADAPASAQSLQRTQQRWQRIEAAAQDLQRWLADQLARGLAALDEASLAGFQTQAARLVDAQAPGLAQRLRDAAAGVRQGSDWPERTLHRLGLLQLACEGLARRSSLNAAQQADLQTLVGWPQDKAELLSTEAGQDDDWFVLGVALDERDPKLVERRVWLQGQRSGARALLLEHAFGGRGFEGLWLPGTCVPARLHFYPGSAPLRAICAQAGAPLAAAGPGADAASGQALNDAVESVADAAWRREWLSIAQRVAACPWQPLHPLRLPAAVPVATDAGWALHIGTRQLPMALPDADGWLLMAASGGTPLALDGEWDGQQFSPLSAWQAGPLHASPLWLRTHR